jgi:hypothetical protein
MDIEYRSDCRRLLLRCFNSWNVTGSLWQSICHREHHSVSDAVDSQDCCGLVPFSMVDVITEEMLLL